MIWEGSKSTPVYPLLDWKKTGIFRNLENISQAMHQGCCPLHQVHVPTGGRSKRYLCLFASCKRCQDNHDLSRSICFLLINNVLILSILSPLSLKGPTQTSVTEISQTGHHKRVAVVRQKPDASAEGYHPGQRLKKQVETSRADGLVHILSPYTRCSRPKFR